MRSQPAAAGEGSGWIHTHTHTHAHTRAGQAIQRSLRGTELRGALAWRDEAEAANRTPNCGSGRWRRGRGCHSVTTPPCKALTFPETPAFPERCQRRAAPGGDLPAPRRQLLSKTARGRGLRHLTTSMGWAAPRKDRHPPPESSFSVKPGAGTLLESSSDSHVTNTLKSDPAKCPSRAEIPCRDRCSCHPKRRVSTQAGDVLSERGCGRGGKGVPAPPAHTPYRGSRPQGRWEPLISQGGQPGRESTRGSGVRAPGNGRGTQTLGPARGGNFSTQNPPEIHPGGAWSTRGTAGKGFLASPSLSWLPAQDSAAPGLSSDGPWGGTGERQLLGSSWGGSRDTACSRSSLKVSTEHFPSSSSSSCVRARAERGETVLQPP